MTVYAVLLRESNDEVAKRLFDHYKEEDYYCMSDTTYLVRSSTIAEKVAVAIGLKGEDRIEDASGVVFKLNHSFAGYSSRDLWDWLEQTESLAV